MQKLFIKRLSLLPLLFLVSILTFTSCEKDSDGSPEVKPGNPQSAGIAPGEAPGGALITLKGTGLGDMRSIVFEKNNVPAPFTTTLNTESAIVFRVPDTAFGGAQKIIFTNSQGKTLEVPFTVIAMPSVTSVSNYNFTTGTQISLKGNNLDDVTSVVFEGNTTPVTIVSKSRKELVISMPATTLSRTKLKITNASGNITTDQEFVSLDNAFKIFTDSYGQDFQDGSWGDAGFISTSEFKSGTKSVGKKYAKGNWHLINFANWWPMVTYSPDFNYFTFWVKGASKDYSLYITSDKGVGGFGSFVESNKINVPANVWTYYKIPLSQLNLWATGNAFQQLGFRIQGPDAQDETFYFDDVMFVK
jgi:hypothetical protein